tara:strand:+ start:1353 stop:2438 length:1086 start_codon:yes stop_codon:yes gene_type:complete
MSDLPESVVKAFVELGNDQRGKPETTMVELQHISAGVFAYVIEHVGDISHRMTETLKWYKGGEITPSLFGYGPVSDKALKCYKMLNSSYGFEREFNINIDNNAHAREMDTDRLRASVKKLSTKYADEHAKLVVYNRPQYLARQAAVHLGRWEFDKTKECLLELNKLCLDKQRYAKEASYYELNNSGKLIPYEKQRNFEKASTEGSRMGHLDKITAEIAASNTTKPKGGVSKNVKEVKAVLKGIKSLKKSLKTRREALNKDAKKDFTIYAKNFSKSIREFVVNSGYSIRNFNLDLGNLMVGESHMDFIITFGLKNSHTSKDYKQLAKSIKENFLKLGTPGEEISLYEESGQFELTVNIYSEG